MMNGIVATMSSLAMVGGTMNMTVAPVMAKTQAAADDAGDNQEKKYDVTTKIDDNGTITATDKVAEGGTKEVKWKANDGYHIKSVVIDDKEQKDEAGKTEGSKSFTDIKENHTVTVTTEKDKDDADKGDTDKGDTDVFKVTTQIDAGGTITESDEKVAKGTSKTVEWQAKEGYHIKSVTIDSKALDDAAGTTKGSTEFKTIDSDHKVVVTTEKDAVKTYKIETEIDDNGTITKSIDDAKGGEPQTIEWKANDGYYIDSVTVDDKEQDIGKYTREGKYTFDKVQGDHKIVVKTAKNELFKITTSIDEGGTITPSDDKAELHKTKTVEWKAKDGYHIASVTVDGQEKTDMAGKASGSITFNEITSDHEVVVKTAKDETKTYKITTSIKNGTITPSEDSVKEKESKTVEWKADKGYHVLKVTVDGKEIPNAKGTTSGKYEFSDIAGDHTVTVETEKDSDNSGTNNNNQNNQNNNNQNNTGENTNNGGNNTNNNNQKPDDNKQDLNDNTPNPQPKPNNNNPGRPDQPGNPQNNGQPAPQGQGNGGNAGTQNVQGNGNAQGGNVPVANAKGGYGVNTAVDGTSTALFAGGIPAAVGAVITAFKLKRKDD